MNYNKGIGVIGIILIIVGILAVGGGAYYFGSNNSKLKDDLGGVQETLEDQNNITFYTSNTYGYSIGYSGINEEAVIVSSEGKNIMFFPNQSDIDNLEIVDSSYIPANYISPVGVVTFGENSYKKYKDNITARHTYYLKTGLKNNKAMFISIEGDSDDPNYINLSSLKIEEPSSTTEESINEVFNNQPGIIKSIKTEGVNSWILEVDLLSFNPNWYPESNDSRYINQNTKIRSLIVNKDTLIKDCRDPNYSMCSNYKDFNFIKENFSNNHIFHFDIAGTIINVIYEPYVS